MSSLSGRSLLFIVMVAALIAAALAWSHAQRHWQRGTAGLLQQLQTAARPLPAADAPAALPAPVARYLRAVLPPGAHVPQRVRVHWAGEFNLGTPGADRWRAFTATQEFAPGAPGFVWDASIALAPGTAVRVRDAYVAGNATMQGRLLALFPVVDRRGGGAFAQAALQRYLGETLWLPAALLPAAGVQWAAIDAQRARAVLTDGPLRAELEFRFGDDGLVSAVFAAQRLYDDGKAAPTPQPWQARVLRWGELEGRRVPLEATVEWLLPGGPFAYWRGRPLRIETLADPAPPAAVQ